MAPHRVADPLEVLATARTWLFVPGSRPDRFDKALATGADLVIVDLEDAVAPAGKDQARRAVRGLLERSPSVAVRINGTGTPWHADDVAVVAAFPVPVVLPGAESPAAVTALAQVCTGGAVLPLVESAGGVLAAAALAAAPGSRRLLLGNVDLGAQLGVDAEDRTALLSARSALVLASAAAGLPAPVDGVTLQVTDAARCSDDARYGRRLGFGGKLCVHPGQIAAVEAGYRAEPAELAWARRVVAGAPEGVGTVDGQMIDAPVLARARALLQGTDD